MKVLGSDPISQVHLLPSPSCASSAISRVVVVRGSNTLELREFDQEGRQNFNSLKVELQDQNTGYLLQVKGVHAISEKTLAVNCGN